VFKKPNVDNILFTALLLSVRYVIMEDSTVRRKNGTKNGTIFNETPISLSSRPIPQSRPKYRPDTIPLKRYVPII
jgi:hypothetical protein